MTPAVLIDKPGGKPVALQVNVPWEASVAVRLRFTVSPTALCCGPGLARAMGGVTVQVKDWLTLAVPSVPVTVTL